MGHLHFSLAFVEFLARHRAPLLTQFFLGASLVGSAWFYVLLMLLVYVAWDKQLAMRLSVLMLCSSALNDLLKMLIANPRPFVEQGTYAQKWAVSPETARNLAMEYSTPSGHAMGAASFYSYLYAFLRSRWMRVAAVLAVLVIGFSRPYLGVHYGEDVLLGWAMGLLVALAGWRLTGPVTAFWSRRSYGAQVALAVAGSLMLCLLATALNGWQLNSQPYGVVVCAGFVTGNVIARGLELRYLDFNPRSGGAAARVLRFLVTAAVLGCTLALLGRFFGIMTARFSPLGYALSYLRYAAAGVAGMLAAPWIFTRMRLAETRRAAAR